jgi:hypothetical protein
MRTRRPLSSQTCHLSDILELKAADLGLVWVMSKKAYFSRVTLTFSPKGQKTIMEILELLMTLVLD